LPDGILRIRYTKFGKTRLVPLHPTAVTALGAYLNVRQRSAAMEDHVFLSFHNRRIASSTVNRRSVGCCGSRGSRRHNGAGLASMICDIMPTAGLCRCHVRRVVSSPDATARGLL
jgi:integrase